MNWKIFVLAMGLILGCSRNSSHPELSQTNEKDVSWQRHEHKAEGAPDLIGFLIKASNRITTPSGEKVLGLSVNCGGNIEFNVASTIVGHAENGEVKIGFDGQAPVGKKWKVYPGKVNDTLSLPAEDESDFLAHLKTAKTFQFEFIPQGGKPQMSEFKLLNINDLMHQEKSCKPAVERMH